MESVLMPEGSLWWERFAKEVGFAAGVKKVRSYGWWEWWVERDRKSGRSRKRQVERLRRGWRREVGSWFQRQDEAYRKERSVVRNENDVGGRARQIYNSESTDGLLSKVEVFLPDLDRNSHTNMHALHRQWQIDIRSPVRCTSNGYFHLKKRQHVTSQYHNNTELSATT